MTDELDFVERLALRDDWGEVEQALTAEERRRERDRVKAHSGLPIRRIALSRIAPSPFLLKQGVDPRLVRNIVLVLAAKKEEGQRSEPEFMVLPPVRLKKMKYRRENYVLIDGLHRWHAYKQRQEDSERGVWEGRKIERDADSATIPARIIAVPPRARPENYLLHAYALAGKRTTREVVEAIFDEKPGIPAARIATLLNISPSTAEKYSRSLRAEWEKKFDDYVGKRLQERYTREQIERLCIIRWPWARGTSASAIWYGSI